ncbi:large subunit ribosomal protein 4 (apicoplast) [Plasmodium gonderi]|uniref:Large ribosomal subunit protein uL4m n=1 Tax=Plasmodium gonderi TaxID=77519 RepID=A0A1Y1JWQ0_PLAGO|nr:large subunit ribosomal protein 4 [Plasmodium gonderi]BBB58246.1 large subunit ribosomal protein 4 [Plasmodium gonderi]GAW84743.1 large subunit ribosomal protein 4 [Plasmodium gonderi]
MNIIILNIKNNIFNNIIFKYKYNFFIKLYLNYYIKIYKIINYIIKYYYIYNIYVYKYTKNRSIINYSNKKIRIQKGTGKARLKNIKSPVCKQGSCSFGPYYVKNRIKYNKFIYKLIFIYLLCNKRSNIIIIKFENIFNMCNYVNIIDFKKFIIDYFIFKILYFNGIVFKQNKVNKYKIMNFYKINNKNMLFNLILYNYIILII